MSVNFNSTVNNANPGQFNLPEDVGENPVEVQMGGEVREVSPAEPNPTLSSQIGGNPPFPEQPDPNALNVAQQNLSLPQEPPAIKRTICPEAARDMGTALQKSTVAAFANELAEIGRALRTPPDLKEVADYRQALDEYRNALTDYGAALDENVQALNKYEDDCKDVKTRNEASSRKFDEAFETWKSANEEVYKLHEEGRKAAKTRNEQKKADYRKVCEETIARAKADYERKCADELAKLKAQAQNDHRAAYDAKVAKYNAHVEDCKNGMAAHLSELKERFGTNTFEDLDRLMTEVFTKESSGYYVQLDGSTKGKLSWYGYKGYFDSSGNAENNRAAWGQLKAS